MHTNKTIAEFLKFLILEYFLYIYVLWKSISFSNLEMTALEENEDWMARQSMESGPGQVQKCCGTVSSQGSRAQEPRTASIQSRSFCCHLVFSVMSRVTPLLGNTLLQLTDNAMKYDTGAKSNTHRNTHIKEHTYTHTYKAANNVKTKSNNTNKGATLWIKSNTTH